MFQIKLDPLLPAAREEQFTPRPAELDPDEVGNRPDENRSARNVRITERHFLDVGENVVGHNVQPQNQSAQKREKIDPDVAERFFVSDSNHGGMKKSLRRRTELLRRPFGSDATYFWEEEMGFPKLISPLSIRMLNPHSGFVQTQALYRMVAPSRP
jgi:hypothetical protein